MTGTVCTHTTACESDRKESCWNARKYTDYFEIRELGKTSDFNGKYLKIFRLDAVAGFTYSGLMLFPGKYRSHALSKFVGKVTVNAIRYGN